MSAERLREIEAHCEGRFQAGLKPEWRDVHELIRIAREALRITDQLSMVRKSAMPTSRSLSRDVEPEGVMRVRDRDGDIWARVLGRWSCESYSLVALTWPVLVGYFGPLTEVVGGKR